MSATPQRKPSGSAMRIAMAAGTGRVIADLLSGREPEIAPDGLTMARYG